MVGTLEVAGILSGPLPLTSDFTRLAALRLAAIGLCLGVAVVREEENPATPALPFSDAFHEPEPPEQSSNIRTNGERKGLKAGRKKKKNQQINLLRRKNKSGRRNIFTQSQKRLFQNDRGT